MSGPDNFLLLDDSVNQFIELPIGLTASFKSVRDRVGGPDSSQEKDRTTANV